MKNYALTCLPNDTLRDKTHLNPLMWGLTWKELQKRTIDYIVDYLMLPMYPFKTEQISARSILIGAKVIEPNTILALIIEDVPGAGNTDDDNNNSNNSNNQSS